MKCNKWTVALAALGVVSLASAAKAEEKASSVMTAVASTTLSGYVDTSAQWNFGTGNGNLPPYRFNAASKADGFNLDVVQLRLEKPLDEAEWAAGYRFDMWAGPDANVLNTTSALSLGRTSDFAIRQAYVSLRVPVYKELDFKFGVFDSIIGYESIESGNNPNYTRSYGNSIEPTTHTGVLATYRFTDMLSASAGVADTASPTINARAQDGAAGFTSGPFASMWNRVYNRLGVSPVTGSNAKSESYKTYMGSVALTAPDTMGFLTGSTLYAGIVSGFDDSTMGSGAGGNQINYYVGATIATPVTGLRAGAAFDYLDDEAATSNVGTGLLNTDVSDVWSVAGYLSYQATEKLSFHGRLEYFKARVNGTFDSFAGGPFGPVVTAEERERIMATTLTAQYDLWKNVISRLELRWDHSLTGQHIFGSDAAGNPNAINAWMLAANIIYKF